MKNRKGFTLIELLVVIAIIAMLLGIVVPSLRKAKEYAKKIICKNNLHQIGIAIGNKDTVHKTDFRSQVKYYYRNGTGDMGYEQPQVRMMEDIMFNDLLPNREVFFCPGIAGVSYDQNFLRSEAMPPNVPKARSMGDIEKMLETDSTKVPAFWTSYCWLWKKRTGPNVKDPEGNEYTSSAVKVNNVSSGVLYTDVNQQMWDMSMNIDNDDGRMLRNLENNGIRIKQTLPHFHALMKDMSVLNPDDKKEEVCYWLWMDYERWAGK